MFGSLTPLPLRLGGSPEEGWSPEQHSRMCADLVAVRRTAWLLVMTYTKAGAVVTVHSYRDQTKQGALNAPSAVVDATGQVTFTLARNWLDEFDDELPVKILGGEGSFHGSTCGSVSLVSHTANAFTFKSFDAAGVGVDGKVTVRLRGTACTHARRLADIGDYGGDVDKQASKYEGDEPYAAAVMDMLYGARPDSMSRSPNSYIGCETLAQARMVAHLIYRLPEKLEANLLPGTADEALDYWLGLLQVARGSLSRRAQRKAAELAYRSAKDPSYPNILALAESTMGDWFEGIELHQSADLATPVYGTYWPGSAHEGNPSDDIGGGTWSSRNDVITVRVSRPTAAMTNAFDEAASRCYAALRVLLPAYKEIQITKSGGLMWSDDSNMPTESYLAGMGDDADLSDAPQLYSVGDV